MALISLSSYDKRYDPVTFSLVNWPSCYVSAVALIFHSALWILRRIYNILDFKAIPLFILSEERVFLRQSGSAMPLDHFFTWSSMQFVTLVVLVLLFCIRSVTVMIFRRRTIISTLYEDLFRSCRKIIKKIPLIQATVPSFHIFFTVHPQAFNMEKSLFKKQKWINPVHRFIFIFFLIIPYSTDADEISVKQRTVQIFGNDYNKSKPDSGGN
jgi:hypothetical protein